MKRLVLLAVVAGCAVEPPPLATLDEVRQAVSEHPALQAEVALSAYTEADGSRFGRRARLDWWADGDFTLTVFADSSDAVAETYHLAGTALTRLGSDSVRTVSEVDPAGEVIPNHFTGLLLPPMLQDTAWFTALAADTTRVQEGLTFTTRAVQDPLDEAYHPETHSEEAWTFDAQTGLPLAFRDAWYRGDLAYGRELEVTWNWTDGTPDAWVEPAWARDPVAVEEADEAEEGDWYEAALSALPEGVAPPLQGHDLGGAPLALSDFSGQITFLDFWYIGCGPCMQALPHLAELQARHASNGFTVLGANSHQDAATIGRYLDRRGIALPQLVLDSLPSADWPVRAYPTWFLIGRDGTVLERGMGFGGEESAHALDSLIQAHL